MKRDTVPGMSTKNGSYLADHFPTKVEDLTDYSKNPWHFDTLNKSVNIVMIKLPCVGDKTRQ